MLPVIDLSGLWLGGETAAEDIGRAIHAACAASGFFYISCHGVPEPVIARAAEAARRFFHQPLEEKQRVAVNASHHGFSALGDVRMHEARRADYNEFFSVGLDRPEDGPGVQAGGKLRGPNQWPDRMPEFRDALSAYQDAMGACGAALLRCVAPPLGLDPAFFADRYRKPLQRTRIIHCPPQPRELGDDQFGVAPHTDPGCLTLLWQDGTGGLEVLERGSREWIAAPPLPGTLVVNVGDLLERWTNGRYTSAPHRVVNRSGRERFSIATFHDPDDRTVIDPRDLGTPEAECRYPPVLAGEHILGWIERSFGDRRKPTG